MSQVHNPFLKTLSVIGDAIGTGLFPKIAAEIPGTTAHHAQIVNAQERKVAEDQALESEAAKNAETVARANQANAHAESLENPAENVQPITTDAGIYGLNKKTGKIEPVSSPDGAPFKVPAKPKALHHVETDQGIFALDPETGSRRNNRISWDRFSETSSSVFCKSARSQMMRWTRLMVRRHGMRSSRHTAQREKSFPTWRVAAQITTS